MKLDHYLALLDDGERHLAAAFELLAERYASDPEIHDTAVRLAAWSRDKRLALAPALGRYGRSRLGDVDRLRDALLRGARANRLGALRDLHDVDVLAHHVFTSWTIIQHSAEALFDTELVAVAKRSLERTERQARWLRTLIQTNSAQALTVPVESAARRAWAPAALALAALGVIGSVWSLLRP